MNVSLVSLWLPIILSAVVVFVASSLIWTVVKYHNSDWQKLPDEEAARNALRGSTPGQYTVPYAATDADRKSEEWQARYSEGPAAMVTVFPQGSPSMGKQLIQWFIYAVAISFLVAYVASVALAPGAEYLQVFRVTGSVAVLAYAGAAPFGSIWFGHTWSRTVKEVIDGLIYGMLTAGMFGWLWP
jgi:hypothetical protein